MSKLIVRISIFLVVVVVAILSGVSVTACGEGECLVSGENCSASYKESEYGTTDVYCCDGLSCTENSLVDFICR